MDGVTAGVHDQIGDIDDIADGAKPDPFHTPLQGRGRLFDLDSAHDATGVTGTICRILDGDRKRLGFERSNDLRKDTGAKGKISETGRYFPADPIMGEPIGSIGGDLDIEDRTGGRRDYTVLNADGE